MDGREIEKLVSDEWRAFASKFSGPPVSVAYEMRSFSDGRLWTTGLNTDRQFFCASAFKAFVLAECLRQWENDELTLDEQFTINDDVRSPGGELDKYRSGSQVTLEFALRKMIEVSDNTATDLILHRVDPDRVRALVSSHGLQNVVIPDSTRRFILQAYGVAPSQPDPGWQAILNMLQGPPEGNPFALSERMAAPASAFVQFYSDALGTDSYLKTEKARDKIVEILATSEPARYFRETLSGGASGIWVKGGRLNLQPYNVVSSAGRIRFGGDRPPRWLDFAFIVNSDVKTNNDAVFRAFLEVNVDVLNLVIDNLDW